MLPVRNIYTTALLPPPHITSHISSDSPERKYFKKNLNSFSSSFCFLIVLHQKYVFVLSFLFFFIQTSFWEDPRSEFFFSYMCWASIMSKYLASMIWGRTLFLSTEKESERHQIRLFPPFFTGNMVNQHIRTPSLALGGGRGKTMAGIVGNKPPDA